MNILHHRCTISFHHDCAFVDIFHRSEYFTTSQLIVDDYVSEYVGKLSTT